MTNLFPQGTPKNIKAVMGVMISESGAIECLKAGEFDLGQAEEMARRLTLLASDIRSAARRKIDFGQ